MKHSTESCHFYLNRCRHANRLFLTCTTGISDNPGKGGRPQRALALILAHRWVERIGSDAGQEFKLKASKKVSSCEMKCERIISKTITQQTFKNLKGSCGFQNLTRDLSPGLVKRSRGIFHLRGNCAIMNPAQLGTSTRSRTSPFCLHKIAYLFVVHWLLYR